ncbi:acyl-CoA-binding domain-containing protein 6 isoform X6 [Chiloscyllium plagiosum]|uniref:acyl-CoA-binding domain-containing protein 6 isoform X6 n=1 Tax=Chiloscyllium plagiosum TaxID=36176 RepID=UPI001CB81402|nr:acyl-CoA-binding domain-containing protein 6 isoform X6 [Chiloscyllium plagiosum]
MAAVSGPASDSEDQAEGAGRALEAEFERAAARVQTLAHAAGRETLLYLYSRFKQAKFGKCNVPKPGFFDFEGKQKWEAWKAVGDMTAQQAMQEYIATVKKLDPEWNPQDSVKESDQKLRFGGPVVSSLYQEEMIRDEDKTIFDHCRENNIDHILKALVSENVDVNLKDEEDSEGQTALHYASACEFADIVELLLNSGADPTIQDGEGCLPEEVTDSNDISQMLRQYAASKG